ncbi:MAG: prepilin-type N-terminal cleavage/methylation domain-containing protein [Thermodesulfobacteriota bacterium]
MSLLRNERGFTFTEIIIAISIMALGFLAMAQMQYLSLRQKQRAEQGTVATNVIQFIADRDMEEVKRAHLLNSIAFVEAQAGRLNAGSSAEPHLQHCMSGNPDRMCDLSVQSSGRGDAESIAGYLDDLRRSGPLRFRSQGC